MSGCERMAGASRGAVLSGILVAAALLVGPGGLQSQVSVGIQADWGTESHMGLGGRGVVALGRLVDGLELTGRVDRYFPGDRWEADATTWLAGVDLVYRLAGSASRLAPYAGLGLGLSRFRVTVPLFGEEIRGQETLWGVDFVAGLVVVTEGFRPFVEGRYVASDRPQLVLSLGIRVFGS